MKRTVTFEAAYDRRNADPKKNYGIHGVLIYFAVIDEEAHAGLTFSIATNWMLPHVQSEVDANVSKQFPFLHHKPQAFGVNIHLPHQMHEYSSSIENCEITGGKCYCDGSATLGEAFLQTLIAGGDKALFERMELQYQEWLK